MEWLRVDSSGWNERFCPDGMRCLENPLGDAWEILDGEFAGEQYFAWWAATREAAALGKRLPSLSELESRRAALPGHGREERRLSWQRIHATGNFGSLGDCGFFWTADSSGPYRMAVTLTPEWLSSSRVLDAWYGLPVALYQNFWQYERFQYDGCEMFWGYRH